MFRQLFSRRLTARKSAPARCRLPALEALEDRTLPAVSLLSFVVPQTGLEGQAVTLSADASTDQAGASLTYSWDFGDGNTASGTDLTDPTHAFAASATPYTVSLTVSDGTDSASTSGQITINDLAPTVNLGAAQTVHAGETATLVGDIIDPGGSGDLTSIQWDFNYNVSTFNPDPSANGFTTASHAYAAPGTYVVAVQAID